MNTTGKDIRSPRAVAVELLNAWLTLSDTTQITEGYDAQLLEISKAHVRAWGEQVKRAAHALDRGNEKAGWLTPSLIAKARLYIDHRRAAAAAKAKAEMEKINL